MSTMCVTFGVSLAKNGILTAARTHLQMFLTSSGSCWEVITPDSAVSRFSCLTGIGKKRQAAVSGSSGTAYDNLADFVLYSTV